MPTLPQSMTNASSLPINLVPPSEPEKESKSKSPVGWLWKRKSLRATDKASKHVHESSLTRDVPTSPVVAEEMEPGSAPPNGISGAHTAHPPSLHPLRRHTEHNISSHSTSNVHSTYQHPEALSSQTMVIPAGSVDTRLGGLDDPASHHAESGSSSPSIGSLRHNVHGGGGSSTTYSNGNGHNASGPSHGQVLEHPPGRASSLAHRRSAAELATNIMNGPSAYNTLPPSSTSPSSPLTTSSSPVLPPFKSNTTRGPLTPSRGHRTSVSNGHIFANGVDAMLKNQTSAPPTPDGGNYSHLSHTTLSPPPPPPSMAASVGANLSSGSANSATSGFKRATRKLSITAPMLGFGRKQRQ